MRLWKLVAIGILGIANIALHAQTALVVPLDQTDTDKAKALYDQLGKIQEQINHLHDDIMQKYLISKVAGDQSLLPFWSSGDFQYSTDYKYIVPGKSVYTTTTQNGELTLPMITGCGITNDPSTLQPYGGIHPVSYSYRFGDSELTSDDWLDKLIVNNGYRITGTMPTGLTDRSTGKLFDSYLKAR